MRRNQALLSAGALTGVVIIALFWWQVSNSEAAANAASPNFATSSAIGVEANRQNTNTSRTSGTTSGATSGSQSLLEQNQQLRETITTLLNREEEYRRQIEAANQQLLSGQNSATNDEQGNGRFWEEGEHEDAEHEEREHEEDDGRSHDHEGEHREHDEDD